MNLSVKIQGLEKLDAKPKQIRFALAQALTKTAKEGQTAVLNALGDTFTLRGNWAQPSNKFGIRIKSAKKDDLTAEIKTAADWLKLHETGGEKTSRTGGNIAVPTENVRRNKREIIVKSQRPNALRGKKTFVLETSRGRVLFLRKGTGKKSKIVALYNLEKRVSIKKVSTFYEPIRRVVETNIADNFQTAYQNALATAK
jgi:hypothetical protein